MLKYLTSEFIGYATVAVAISYILYNLWVRKFKSFDLARLVAAVPTFLIGIKKLNLVFSAWTRGIGVFTIPNVGDIEVYIVLVGLCVASYVSILGIFKIFGFDVEEKLSSNLKKEKEKLDAIKAANL